MHASLTAVGVAFVAVFIGCNQSDSPTSPTSDFLRSASNALVGDVVPFKGRLEGTSTVTFDPPPSPFFTVLLEGTGTTSHLGRFTIEAPHRVDTRTGTAIGSLAFTAANGDVLTADFTGASGPSATPGAFAIVETASITGGTGRFAGATGSFIVERVVDMATLLTAGSFAGTISSPGSNKR